MNPTPFAPREPRSALSLRELLPLPASSCLFPRRRLNPMGALWIWLLLCAATASAASSPPFPEDLDPARLDAFLAARVKQPQQAGLSVAVVRNGRLLLAKGYGPASLVDRRPVTTNTLFAIGSVSKQFTCAAVLLLAGEGRVSVHDPVARFYPELTRASDITLLDLMQHVSGYPDYYPLDFVDRRMLQPVGTDELIRNQCRGPLDFEPGSRWSYSNTGFLILGRVVERVSGQPLGRFFEERFFTPLGMTNTVYEPDPTDPRLAGGNMTFALGPGEPVAPEAAGWLGAAGGIYSTPLDLVVWNLALAGGRVLGPQQLGIMTTARVLSSGRSTDYGCGISTRAQAGRLVLSHGGAVSGFATWSAVVPSLQAAVVFVANMEGSLGDVPRRTLNLLLQEPPDLPVMAAPPATEVVELLFRQFQQGRLDRTRLAPEFSWFLNPERFRAASSRLRRLGAVRGVELVSLAERGGLEVSSVRVSCRRGTVRTLMYRRPGGVVEQFFVAAD